MTIIMAIAVMMMMMMCICVSLAKVCLECLFSFK